jgi:replicative DNA helicase
LIKKFKDIADNLELMRNTGNPMGELSGFSDLDEIYSIKQGSFTFILAAPHHGKSEFAFELAFNQAHKYGKKSLIYSPETGSVEDIYAEFIHKYTGRPFYKSIPGAVEDREYFQAINYIDEMFNVVDSDDKSYSIPEIMSLVRDEKIIITDPYNELRHEMGNYNGRQDLYIEDIIGEEIGRAHV